jgi:hypothetical protein
MWGAIVVGVLIILVLVLKVVALNARLEGMREAQHHAGGGGGGGGGGLDRVVRVLAIVGLLALLGACFYAGSVAAALNK